LARLPIIPRRHWLTGIGLLCLFVWGQGLPVPTNASTTGDDVTAESIASPVPTPTIMPISTAGLTNTPTVAYASTAVATFDALDPRTSFSMILTTLQSTGTLPTGGRLLFFIPESYAVTNSSGDNFLPLGGGKLSQDFVLGVQLGWYSAGHDSACGLSFRANPSDWRAVLVTSAGHLLMTRQTGTTRVINADLPISSFSGKPYKNALWLVVSGSTTSVYLNGQLQATSVDDTTNGGFALEVYNALDNVSITDCRYRNLWVWSYDGSPTVTPSLTITNSP
jgi:hypothetical protein